MKTAGPLLLQSETKEPLSHKSFVSDSECVLAPPPLGFMDSAQESVQKVF